MDADQIEIERDKLRLERQRLAFEISLKRREVARSSPSVFRDLLANPLSLAVVGGVLTLITQIASNHFSQADQREAEKQRADIAMEASSRALQADLIKKFAEAPNFKAARENLEFLLDAGLLPDYEIKISKYLKENPQSAPQLSIPVGGVTGPDNRKLLSTLPQDKRQLFRAIGKLMVIDTKKQQSFCTAFFVAPRIIATASFCVPEAAVLEAATFTLFDDSDEGSRGERVLRVNLGKMVRESAQDTGVVLIGLEDGEVDSEAFFPLATAEPALDSAFAMAFYSGERNDFVISDDADCRVTKVTGNMLLSKCDTGFGSSGSPLLLDGKVIGIHIGNYPDGKHAWRADLLRKSSAVSAAFGELPL
jgi:V8-like Glu-specific endopeptidase